MPVNRWELQKSIPPVSGSTFEISISSGWQYEACATPAATLKHSAAGSTGQAATSHRWLYRRIAQTHERESAP